MYDMKSLYLLLNNCTEKHDLLVSEIKEVEGAMTYIIKEIEKAGISVQDPNKKICSLPNENKVSEKTENVDKGGYVSAPLWSYIRECMLEIQRPCRAAEITRVLVYGKSSYPGKISYGIVFTILSNRSDIFMRVGKGLWALREIEEKKEDNK
jgi:hypothetical protein